MPPKYIDIHSHLHFADFDNDREAVLKRTLDAGVWMINVGVDYNTSEGAVKLANSFPTGVFATVGLHPNHDGERFDYDAYKKLAEDPKVVAIGECGLDYYRMSGESIQKQKEILEAHIGLANELGKPLMLHIRNSPEPGDNAYKYVLDILKGVGPKVRGNVHFFAGSLEDARAFLDHGFTLSFTGAITFPKSNKPGMPDYEEIIKFAPLDLIMAETDCPYVAPVPYRGKRNEPAYVEYVVKRIAEIKGLPEDEVAPILLANAKGFLGFKN